MSYLVANPKDRFNLDVTDIIMSGYGRELNSPSYSTASMKYRAPRLPTQHTTQSHHLTTVNQSKLNLVNLSPKARAASTIFNNGQNLKPWPLSFPPKGDTQPIALSESMHLDYITMNVCLFKLNYQALTWLTWGSFPTFGPCRLFLVFAWSRFRSFLYLPKQISRTIIVQNCCVGIFW